MIDMLWHLIISVPSLPETQITFYGTLGFVMFHWLCIMGIVGCLCVVNKIKKKIGRGME